MAANPIPPPPIPKDPDGDPDRGILYKFLSEGQPHLHIAIHLDSMPLSHPPPPPRAVRHENSQSARAGPRHVTAQATPPALTVAFISI